MPTVEFLEYLEYLEYLEQITVLLEQITVLLEQAFGWHHRLVEPRAEAPGNRLWLANNEPMACALKA